MRTYKWLLIGGSVMLLAAVISLFSSMPYRASAGTFCTTNDCYANDSTIAEFVQGSLYATGLSGGITDDGNVQLLPIGLSSDWFTDTHRLPIKLAELSSVIFADKIFAIGGISNVVGTGNAPQNTIYSAPTNMTTGALTAGFTLAGTLPDTLSAMAAAVYSTGNGGFLYIVGGSADAGLTVTSTISYRPIDANGNLTGSWTKVVDALPEGLAYPQAVVQNGNLYVLGGYAGFGWAQNPTIYRFTLNPSTGSIGTYSTEATALAPAVSSFAAVTWTNSETGANYLYSIGGTKENAVGNNIEPAADVAVAQFSGSSIGTFSVGGSLNDALTAHGGAQQNGRIFTTGGSLGINRVPITGVFASLIDPDGTIHNWGGGSYWLPSFPIPHPRVYHGTVINSGGYLYVIGGYGPSTEGEDNGSNTVYYGSTAGVGQRYAPKGTFTSRAINLTEQRNITQIQVGSTITATGGMSMAVQYRYANTLNDLLNAAWRDTPRGLNTGTNVTTTFSVNFSASFIQYKTVFTSTTDFTQTPSLHAFQVRYPPPPTPTRTNTPPTVATYTPSPTVWMRDLYVVGIAAPPAPSVPMSQTFTMRVSNIGTRDFSVIPRLQIAATATPRAASAAGAATPLPSRRANAATRPRSVAGDPYFAWVELYIDWSGPITTTVLGNCANQNNDAILPPTVYLGDLPANGWKDYTITCWVGAGTHSFYAQVDTCDNPSSNPDYMNTCGATTGYIVESNEANNVYGPVASGSTIPTMTPTPTRTRTPTGGAPGTGGNFLPLIKKNQ